MEFIVAQAFVVLTATDGCDSLFECLVTMAVLVVAGELNRGKRTPATRWSPGFRLHSDEPTHNSHRRVQGALHRMCRIESARRKLAHVFDALLAMAGGRFLLQTQSCRPYRSDWLVMCGLRLHMEDAVSGSYEG